MPLDLKNLYILKLKQNCGFAICAHSVLKCKLCVKCVDFSDNSELKSLLYMQDIVILITYGHITRTTSTRIIAIEMGMSVSCDNCLFSSIQVILSVVIY